MWEELREGEKETEHTRVLSLKIDRERFWHSAFCSFTHMGFCLILVWCRVRELSVVKISTPLEERDKLSSLRVCL